MGRTPTGAKDSITKDVSIIVFPNPSKNTFTFNISFVEEETDIDVKIEDINGHTIDEIKKHLRQGPLQEFTWNATAVSSGIYYYRAKLSKGKIITGKLAKM